MAVQKTRSTARGTSIARTANTATPGKTSRIAASCSPWRAKIADREAEAERSSGSRRTGCQSRRKISTQARFAPARSISRR